MSKATICHWTDHYNYDNNDNESMVMKEEQELVFFICQYFLIHLADEYMIVEGIKADSELSG